MRIFLCAVLLWCALGPAMAAMLQGYGTVERCFNVPDRTIPTCDGAEYSVFDDLYCYVVELGCNILVRTEAVLSPMKTTFAQIHKEITEPMIEYGNNLFCKMTYPYEGYYVALGSSNVLADLKTDADMMCMALYINTPYDCYQNRNDDGCEYDYYGGSFYNTEHQETFLSALFSTELPQVPCEIGISRLMVSTGASFSLWAQAYTQPTLVVALGDEKCYAKLEQGHGTLNINMDGVVYHVVE